METLIKRYPVHIEKEDKHFFIPSMEYLSMQEQTCDVRRVPRIRHEFPKQHGKP